MEKNYTLPNEAKTLNDYLCVTIRSFEVRVGNFTNRHFKKHFRMKDIKEILTVLNGKKVSLHFCI